MSEKKSMFDRRTVLRATAGLTATVGAAGLVSADDGCEFEVNDCVEIDVSVSVTEACDSFVDEPVDEDGAQGTVVVLCEETDRVGVEWDDDDLTDGFADCENLVPCDD